MIFKNIAHSPAWVCCLLLLVKPKLRQLLLRSRQKADEVKKCGKPWQRGHGTPPGHHDKPSDGISEQVASSSVLISQDHLVFHFRDPNSNVPEKIGTFPGTCSVILNFLEHQVNISENSENYIKSRKIVTKSWLKIAKFEKFAIFSERWRVCKFLNVLAKFCWNFAIGEVQNDVNLIDLVRVLQRVFGWKSRLHYSRERAHQSLDHRSLRSYGDHTTWAGCLFFFLRGVSVKIKSLGWVKIEEMKKLWNARSRLYKLRRASSGARRELVPN